MNPSITKAYLDNNATTPLSPGVLEAMRPFFEQLFHNPSSVGGEVVGLREAIGRARRQVSNLLGAAETGSLVFTSGATESNNWVVNGVADRCRAPGHVITSSVEHPSVIEPMRQLEDHGWDLTVLPVSPAGLVAPECLREALQANTALVSIMTANNETGVIQPVAELASVTKELAPKAVFHTDATQAVGKIRLCLTEELGNVDLLSLSAHKLHGPKGCGALFIREGTELRPLLVGGGQEDGWRSGTTNVPSVVGFGKAASEAQVNLSHMEEVALRRDTFERELTRLFPDAIVHGVTAPRLPNTSCFSLPKCNASILAELLACSGIFVGTGSACSSGAIHPPKTLLAMGVEYELALCSIRLSLSHYTTPLEVRALLEELPSSRETSMLHGVRCGTS